MLSYIIFFSICSTHGKSIYKYTLRSQTIPMIILPSPLGPPACKNKKAVTRPRSAPCLLDGSDRDKVPDESPHHNPRHGGASRRGRKPPYFTPQQRQKGRPDPRSFLTTLTVSSISLCPSVGCTKKIKLVSPSSLAAGSRFPGLTPRLSKAFSR